MAHGTVSVAPVPELNVVPVDATAPPLAAQFGEHQGALPLLVVAVSVFWLEPLGLLGLAMLPQ